MGRVKDALIRFIESEIEPIKKPSAREAAFDFLMWQALHNDAEFETRFSEWVKINYPG